MGSDSNYEPFSGIVLTDTFNLHTERTGFPKAWLPDNSERAERQQKLPIQVIVGNPPWSAGQRSSADDNPNVSYPEIEERVAETYAAHSTTTLKRSLYDTYKLAIRWASDRIDNQGIVAFVTNGSWIDGNVDAGVRACLVKEFNSIHVINLRGHTWKGGERGRAEGGPVFGQGSSATVAVTILVRNPNAEHDGCRILYRDIGDYLKREDKLQILSDAGSIAGIDDWREIIPDQHNDWIGQRDEAYQKFYPMGSKEAKAGRTDEAIFKLYSRGLATSRDAYIYNFSHDNCAANARAVVGDYQGALQFWKDHPEYTVDDTISRYSSNVRWDRELKNNLRRRKVVTYSMGNIWTTQYRPFVKQYCYVDYVLVNNKYQMDRIFPAVDTENRVICVPGVGSTKPFSVLLVDTMPDIQLMFNGQFFPRYRYEQANEKQKELFDDTPALRQIDNITDTALKKFRVHYGTNKISKDDIFDCVYGILHAPDYRKHFANDLSKELPRIPMAPDFFAFANAGRSLAALHLGYETCEEYPLVIESEQPGEQRPEHYRIGARAMKYADNEKTVLIVNDHIRVSGIPAEAHRYEVNGRTPLGWFIDRYRVKRDTKSGIVNDPNEWFKDPRDLIPALRRIVHLSVETVRIVERLPEPFQPEQMDLTIKG